LQLNGRTIFAGTTGSGARVVTRQVVKTAPKQPDQAEEYLHIPLPSAGLVVRGANAFTLAVAGATQPVEVTDLELRYDYQHDLEKLWLRTPVELNRR